MSLVFIIVLSLVVIYAAANLVSHYLNSSSPKDAPKNNNSAFLKKLAERYLLVYTTSEVINKRDLDGTIRTFKNERSIYPTWNFGAEGVTIKCAKELKSVKIDDFLRSLAPTLNLKNLIPTQFLLNIPTGVPSEYYLKYATLEEIKLYDVLLQAGLTQKNSFGDIVRPEFTFKDSTITLNCSQFPLALKDIQTAVPIFNTLNDTLTFSVDKITYNNNVYTLVAQTKAQMIIKKGESVASNFAEYQNVINNNIGSWVFGQNIQTGEILKASYLERAHIACIGMSGSGKTQLLKSVLFARIAAEPKTKILYFDGKASQDFKSFNEATSSFKTVAIPQAGVNPTVEVSNIINTAWAAYEERKQLLASAGCSNFAEYNKLKPNNKIEALIIVLEEAPVLFSNYLDYTKEMDIPNSTSNRIKRLMNEARSYNIQLCFCSQGPDNNYLPTQISKNLLVLIGKCSIQAANYFQNPLLTTLNKSFVLIDEGMSKEFTSFYLGSDNQVNELISNLKLPAIQKIDYNQNEIMFRGSEESRIEILNLMNCVLFKDYEKKFVSSNPESDDLLLSVSNKKHELDVLMISKDEFYTEYLQKLIAKTHAKNVLVVLDYDIAGSFFSKAAKEEQAKLSKPTVFLTQSRLLKAVGKAYSAGDSEEVLAEFFDELEVIAAKLEATDLDLTDDDEGEESNSATVGYSSAQVLESVKEVSLKEYQRITSLKGNTQKQKTKKGQLFEAFIAKLMTALNPSCEVLIGLEAKKFFSEKLFGDGGVDVILKHEDSSVTLIQTKNYANFNVSKESVTSFSFARKLAEKQNIKVRDLIFITTTQLTSDASICAQADNIKVLEGGAILNQIAQTETKLKKKVGRPSKKGEAA